MDAIFAIITLQHQRRGKVPPFWQVLQATRFSRSASSAQISRASDASIDGHKAGLRHSHDARHISVERSYYCQCREMSCTSQHGRRPPRKWASNYPHDVSAQQGGNYTRRRATAMIRYAYALIIADMLLSASAGHAALMRWALGSTLLLLASHSAQMRARQNDNYG